MCTNSKKVSNFNPNLANDKSIFSIYSTLFELYIDKQEPCGRNKGINMLGHVTTHTGPHSSWYVDYLIWVRNTINREILFKLLKYMESTLLSQHMLQ